MNLRYIIAFALFSLVLLASQVLAQNITPDIHPAPLVRLTGVLEILPAPRLSVFPVLRVWLDETPRVFRVAHVEAVIPAYPAEEYLRKVASLGLRFLVNGAVRTALLSPAMHDRPIVIEGWLRPKAGLLRIRAVRVEEESQE